MPGIRGRGSGSTQRGTTLLDLTTRPGASTGVTCWAGTLVRTATEQSEERSAALH